MGWIPGWKLQTSFFHIKPKHHEEAINVQNTVFHLEEFLWLKMDEQTQCCGSEKMTAFFWLIESILFLSVHSITMCKWNLRVSFILFIKRYIPQKKKNIFVYIHHKVFLNPVCELSLYLGKWPLSLITQSSWNTVECEV